MSDPTLREVIVEYLEEHGYERTADPSYWTVTRGDDHYCDKLVPMVIDCLEKES